MSKIYFIADTHFFSSSLLDYENRPFEDVYKMNDYIIDKWNNVVEDNDEIYLLGDFSDGNKEDDAKIMNKLNNRISG